MSDKKYPTIYEFRVQGHLSPVWQESFEGLTITLEDNGNTCLTGEIVDQSALHGVIKRIRDLGIPLLEVKRKADSDTPNLSY